MEYNRQNCTYKDWIISINRQLSILTEQQETNCRNIAQEDVLIHYYSKDMNADYVADMLYSYWFRKSLI